MSASSEITSDYLSARPSAAAFLNSRRRFTRRLGSKAEFESQMVEADSDSHRSLAAFRGIEFLNPSPFGSGKLQDFRGVIKSRFDGMTNPDIQINDGLFDNRYRITPQRPDFHEDDLRKAEEPDYGRVNDWIYLEQHPQVGDLLAENASLRESYFDQRFSSDYQLEQQTAEYARRNLNAYSQLDEQYLAAHPEEAKLLGLNIGGAADIVNDHPELAQGLTEEPRTNYSHDVRQELACDTAAVFKDSTGLDEDFFSENPAAAVYLQNHPGLIEKFNQRPEEAQNFRRHYGVIKNQIEHEVIEDAANSLAGQGMFVQDYLQDNPQFAFDIAADDRIKTQDSIRENILLDDTLEDKNTFTDRVYEQHSAARAETALDSALSRSILEDHPKLSYTIQKSGELADGLKSDNLDLRRFLGLSGQFNGEVQNLKGAMNSLAAGYPLRNPNMVDLWI